MICIDQSLLPMCRREQNQLLNNFRRDFDKMSRSVIDPDLISSFTNIN